MPFYIHNKVNATMGLFAAELNSSWWVHATVNKNQQHCQRFRELLLDLHKSFVQQIEILWVELRMEAKQIIRPHMPLPDAPYQLPHLSNTRKTQMKSHAQSECRWCMLNLCSYMTETCVIIFKQLLQCYHIIMDYFGLKNKVKVRVNNE